jgi:hypothetical protein
VLGFFAGGINFFGWLFDLASITEICSNVAVQLYAIFHPDLVIEPWHVYIAYILISITVTLTCVFANRLLPIIQDAGMILVMGGGLVTIIVLAAIPDRHASSTFVWKDFENKTGWSNGVAFLTGILNGAFTIGTVDAVSHMAEELPQPERDLPKAVLAQVGLGFLSRPSFPFPFERKRVLNGNRRIFIRHRVVLLHIRSRCRTQQQRILSPGHYICPSHGYERRNLLPPVHSSSLASDLSGRNSAHLRPYMVVSCAR